MRRNKKIVPGLDTTSTADISFMLLIFFLMTSSMDSDKGLPRQLPPPEDEHLEQELLVKERNVMEISIDAANRLTCNGEEVTPAVLTDRVAEFVANETDDPSLPEKSTRELSLVGLCQVSDRHVLSIQVDRHTTYDAYFRVQNAIVAAYSRLRDNFSLRQFHHPYAQCSDNERDVIGLVYPQRISEALPVAGGAAPVSKGGGR